MLPELNRLGSNLYECELGSADEAARLALSRGVARGGAESAERCDAIHREYDGRKWVDFATVAGIQSRCARPPQKLIDAVDSVRRRVEGKLDTPARRRRQRVRHLEEGCELDAQSWLERRADAWEDFERVRVPRRVLSVGVNLSVSSSTDWRHLVNRGAAAVAVADELQKLGHSVELVGLSGFSGADHLNSKLSLRYVVKPADAPLDCAAATAVLADVAFFRLVVMVCLGRVCPGVVGHGFGYPAVIGAKLARVDMLMDGNIFSEDAAVASVEETVRKFKEECNEVQG